MTLRIAAATDVGLRRERNEDCFATWSPQSSEELERRGELLVVADGMGGSAAGEVASRTAVETVMHHFREREETADLALTRSLEAAHRAIHRMSVENADLAGDTLLLCSDGLHGLVSDEELARVAGAADLDGATADLIELARSRGGHDNITVVLARRAPGPGA